MGLGSTWSDLSDMLISTDPTMWTTWDWFIGLLTWLWFIWLIISVLVIFMIVTLIYSLIIAYFYWLALKKVDSKLKWTYWKNFTIIFRINLISSLIMLPTCIIPIPFLQVIVWGIVFYILLKKKLIKDWIIEEDSKKIANNTLVWTLILGFVIWLILALITFWAWLIWWVTSWLWKWAYDKQMEKSRDAQRMTNTMLIQSSIEEYFAEKWKYPTLVELKKYNTDMWYEFPLDPKEWEEIDWCKFWFNYEPSTDLTKYRVSTCMEFDSMKLRTNDNWIYENKYEIFK